MREVSYWGRAWRQITKEAVRILMFGGTCAQCCHPLETCTGSARARIRMPGFVFLVPARGESNHASNLFFQKPFIPQICNRHASRGGIEGLPGQGHELIWVPFVAKNECAKQPVLNGLPTHDAMLCA